MKLGIAAAAAALLLTAACSGEPEVLEPDPTPTTPSPTPSAAAPTMPAQAKEDSTEGAVAFIGHWVDAFNAAAKSGDTEYLQSLASGCEACASYARAIEETAADGDAPSGDLWKLGKLTIEEGDESTDVVAAVRTRSSEGTAKHDIAFILTPDPPWQVTDIYRVEP